MALRDYLNFESYADFANFTLQNGQAVAIVTMDGVTPLETWYYNASSMAVPDGTNVFKPNAVPLTSPGRYIKNMTASDWSTTLNKPVFADVALTGDYNDLENKIVAGIGIIMDNNEISVDDGQFMSKVEANAAILQMQTEIATKVPEPRTITINGITQDLEANRDWEVGDLSSSGSYNNPSWINSLNYSKITNRPSTVSGYGITDFNSLGDLRWSQLAHTHTFASLTSKPTTLTGYGIVDAYPLTGNPSGFLTTVPAQSWSSITDKPTIPSNTSQLTNGAGFINASQVIPSLGITPIDASGARNAISLTTVGSSGASTYSPSTGVLNIPNYNANTRTFNNNVTRSLNSNFTISSAKDANVNYSVALSVTNPLLVGTSTASAFLEYSVDSGTSWITVSQVANSSSVALTVTVAITLPNTFVIGGNIPANSLVRIRTTTSGTASATFVRAQEMLY